MVIMEQSTGNVVAMIGGRGEKNASRTRTGSIPGPRSPVDTREFAYTVPGGVRAGI